MFQHLQKDLCIKLKKIFLIVKSYFLYIFNYLYDTNKTIRKYQREGII